MQLNFFRAVFSTLWILVAWAQPTFAQNTKIRISHQWSAETDARDRAARLFAAEVAKRQPKISVSIHPSSQLGIEPLQQYDAMLDGRIEAAIFPLFYISPQIPELSVTLLPGVPANIAQANVLKGSDFHRQLQTLLESKGIHLLTWWWLKGGLVSIDKEIGSPDDFKGIHVRSGDALFDLMFAHVGAVPMSMPSTEIVALMKTRRLNIAQASLETLLSMRMQSVATSAVIGGNSLYVSLHPLMISTKVWNALGEADRKALEQAAEIADKDFIASQDRIEADVKSAFTAAGVKTRPMSYDEYVRWVTVANETSWAAYRKQGAASSELFNSMLTSLMKSAPAAAK